MTLVTFTYDGSPLTGVLFSKTYMTAQINAVPGTCEIYVRDPEGVLSFTTGKEVTCSVGGTVVWGGYLTQISRTHMFPDVISPLWVLRGVDYNIIFDKRVVRNVPPGYNDPNFVKPYVSDSQAYLKAIPFIAGSTNDGVALASLVANYADMSDFTTSCANVTTVSSDGTSNWSYVQQGSKIRAQFEDLAVKAGALYYAAPDKTITYIALEDALSTWGFSDTPDNVTMFGYRAVEGVEDGSVIVNDALIWGGSQYTPDGGGTVFSRKQDATSQTDHGRWQVGETHFGEEGYGIQSGVDARANAIVLGPPGADALNQQKGLRYPQWQLHFTWLHDRVPGILQPGAIVPIDMTVFGVSLELPLRSLRISFPAITDEAGVEKDYVQYEGDFSLLATDPYSLWAFLMRRMARPGETFIAAANDSSTSTVFGAYGSFTPTLVSGLTYSLPYSYVPGTLLVYDAGLLLTPGVDVTETDPEAGTFTLGASPTTPLFATARTGFT